MAESFRQECLSIQDVLTVLLKDGVVREHMLAQPHLTTTLAQHATTISGMNCTTIQHVLAAYLDAEQLGCATEPTYRNLALHLHQCATCFELYCVAAQISAVQSTGELPRWPS
jgi:hypothetical protein